MKQLTIRQTRQSLSRLDRILEAEGEVTITKRGKAVARLVPVKGKILMPSHSDLRAKMKRAGQDSAKFIRADRDAR